MAELITMYFGIIILLLATSVSENRADQGCLAHRFLFPALLTPTSNPVQAGAEGDGNPLYPCRAYVSGDVIPGKASGRKNVWICWVGYGGKAYAITDNEKFDVLTNPKGANFTWVRGGGGAAIIPETATVGRMTNGDPLFISECREVINGRKEVMPGKYHAASSMAYYTWGQKEVKCTDYDVLTCS